MASSGGTRGAGFSETTKREARLRQWGFCGHCGRSLNDLWEEAHHIRPLALGGPNEVNNCVILCGTCHYAAHDFGRFQSLIATPEDWFPYLHGHR